MEAKKYLDDITEIKNIMNRSSRFISLSGLSGVLAGIYALIGAYFAYLKLNTFLAINPSNYARDNSAPLGTGLIFDLGVIAVAVVLAALITGAVLSIRKAKKSDESIWNKTSQRLVINFFYSPCSGRAVLLSTYSKRKFSASWLGNSTFLRACLRER